MNKDQTIGLGPFVLVLPAYNKGVTAFPPDDETWKLIIRTIQLIRRHNKKKPQLWTDGTF
jgi:hypothetical protein